MVGFMEVMTEDGRRVQIAEAQASVEEVRDISPALAPDGSGKATFKGKRAEMCIMYSPDPGYIPSKVPLAHAHVYLARGFTVKPTAEAPEVNIVCGVKSGNGKVCVKKFREERYRLAHIRAYHSDIAPWILTDEEKRKLKGELGVPTPVVAGSSAEVDSLRQQVAELTSLVKAGIGKPAEKKSRFVRNHTPHADSCTTKARFNTYTDGCPRCEELKGGKES